MPRRQSNIVVKRGIWIALLVVIVLTLVPAVGAQGDVWLDSPVPTNNRTGAGFGENNPAGGQAFHNAVDILAGMGDPIRAVADGCLIHSTWWPSWSTGSGSTGKGHGITPVIYHPASGLFTYYAHAQSVTYATLTEPVLVHKGDIIAQVGITGKTTGPHIHFGVRNTGPADEGCWSRSCWLDPDSYLGIQANAPVADCESARQFMTSNPSPAYAPEGVPLPPMDVSAGFIPNGAGGPEPIPILAYEEVPGNPAAQVEAFSQQPQADDYQAPNPSGSTGLTETGRNILLAIGGLGLALIFFGYLGRSRFAQFMGLLVVIGVAAAFVGLTSGSAPARLAVQAAPPAVQAPPTTQPVTQPMEDRLVLRQGDYVEVVVTIFDDEESPPGSEGSIPSGAGITPPSPNGCPEMAKVPLRISQWCTYILEAAQATGLEPSLIAAVIDVESNGKPNALNPDSQAAGLMQIIASDSITAAEHPGVFNDRPKMAKLLSDPRFNINWGAKYLAGVIRNGGSVYEGLRRYYGLHPESSIEEDYANRVINLANSYK